MFLDTGFYGRRKGRVLSHSQKQDLFIATQQYAIDVSFAAPEKLERLFRAPVMRVRLEIGFGKGEHLLSSIQSVEEEGVIGVEPFINGFAKVASCLVNNPAGNVRIYNGHASEMLAWIPESSLSEVDLFYPDPWMKRRHWKRRFINQKNLIAIARVLKKGGIFRFASDIEEYVDWTIFESGENQLFKCIVGKEEGRMMPFLGWVSTAYEKKARDAGRPSFYLSFEKK